MLIQFEIENFGPMAVGQTLSLVASNYDKTLPDSVINTELSGLSGTKLLKSVALYGPNASGKSTVIKAARTLQRLVVESGSWAPDAEMPYNPFRLAASRSDDPTRFSIVFMAEGTRYEYEVRYDRYRVLYESLAAYPKGRRQQWFVREWIPDANDYDWARRSSGNFRVSIELIQLVRENALLVSSGALFKHKQLTLVHHWFTNSLKFLNLGVGGGLDPGFSAGLAEREDGPRERFMELLRHADLGVIDARIDVEEVPDKVIEALAKVMQPDALDSLGRNALKVMLHHRGIDGEVALDWDAESAGTQRLFALAGPWLDILESGHTAFIDELDASLHPVLVDELLRLLHSPVANSSGAQIIFTTHNPYLLRSSALRRDQVWFTEKNGEGAASLYPLSDYRPRPDESRVNAYLSGRYGAVPVIPAGMGV